MSEKVPKWLKILGRKLRKYQTEHWWLIMQRLLKETYEEIKNDPN